MWTYRALVLRVLDGDTVRLLVDLGFYARQQVDLRLKDVAAPELNQPGGPEAREFVATWLASTPRLDWPLVVTTEVTHAVEPTQTRTFARYVGDIWSGDRHLNADINQYLGR